MNPTENTIRSSVQASLMLEGVSWQFLVMLSTQIIAFGSTVFDLNGDASDADILCVGNGYQTHKSSRIDLNWITPQDCEGSAWLESELATHVAKYGVWLYGLDSWSASARVTETTRQSKANLISERIDALYKRQRFLHQDYLQKHAIHIRRDLQRLYLLEVGQPVIPTSLLDYTWHLEGNKSTALQQLLNSPRFSFDVIDKGFQQAINYSHISFPTPPEPNLLNKLKTWLNKHLEQHSNLQWSQIAWRTLRAK